MHKQISEYSGELIISLPPHASVNASDFPKVSGSSAVAVSASTHTIMAVSARPVVRLTCHMRSIHWCSGISSTSAPRIKLVTVAATVTRRLVPKCSAVLVTNTER